MPSPSDGEEKVIRRRRTPVRSAVVDTEQEVVSRPRKTAVRKAPVKRAPRKVAPRKMVEDDEERIEDNHEGTNRKAPTSIRKEQFDRQQRKRQMITIGVIMFVGIGASAAVGFTDKGVININQTIEERNERIRTNTTDERDVNTSLVEVPVQSAADGGKSAGGFVGMGAAAEAPAPKEEPVASASTTDQTASSTETIATSTESVETVEEEKVDDNDDLETEEVSTTE